jgi:phosphoserine phosphatase
LSLAAAYGDTSGDREMLAIAHEKGYRIFGASRAESSAKAKALGVDPRSESIAPVRRLIAFVKTARHEKAADLSAGGF